MIGIIDYGMGNIHSVQKALEFLDSPTAIVRSAKGACKYRKLVLPGVGAFDDAMAQLRAMGMIPLIKEHVADNKPFLGICLGLQLLFESSREAKKEKGLGILKGEVAHFNPRPGLKVPHMGWNQLKIVTSGKSSAASQCRLLKNIPDDSYVYFCHSYYVKPKEKDVTAATCFYGVNFSAVICKDNIYGVQFHPEKSQDVGKSILKNFIQIP